MKHIYFMPGMAANCQIFENIKLDENNYTFHYIEWLEPLVNESLEAYTLRICKSIVYEKPILIGVSFGGIIVQEIAKRIPTEKVIIISSVKDPSEFPQRMKWAKKMKLYRIFPTHYVNFIENLSKKIVSSKKIHQRIDMYQKYLTMRSENYLDWAFKNTILWENKNPVKNVFHLHGSKDHIFPAKRIQNAEILENGTHVMILVNARWINTKLKEILEKESL
ncbi:MAG TPA: alpha/beta hydrolase [Flavobacterium sp.]|nr:alpha/beta hydrolase [Flavobacterium sp.]